MGYRVTEDCWQSRRVSAKTQNCNGLSLECDGVEQCVGVVRVVG